MPAAAYMPMTRPVKPPATSVDRYRPSSAASALNVPSASSTPKERVSGPDEGGDAAVVAVPGDPRRFRLHLPAGGGCRLSFSGPAGV